jgi:hypothetical protein
MIVNIYDNLTDRVLTCHVEYHRDPEVMVRRAFREVFNDHPIEIDTLYFDGVDTYEERTFSIYAYAQGMDVSIRRES